MESHNPPLKPWQGTLRAVPLILLIVSNLIPLFGVFLWNWNVQAILVLYWSENLILGGLTIVKMLLRSPILGILSSGFFLIHYGGFCAVHGMLVLALTGAETGDSFGGDPWPLWLIFVQLLFQVIVDTLILAPSEWLIGFAGLLISHCASFGVNYLYRGEFQQAELGELMKAPYKRIVILHLAIIFGGWGVMALGSPLALLVVLVALKIGIDIYSHWKEHRGNGEEVSASA